MFEVPPLGLSKVPNPQGLGISHLDSLLCPGVFGKPSGDARTVKHHNVGVGHHLKDYTPSLFGREREGNKPIPCTTTTSGSPGTSRVVEVDNLPQSTPSLFSESSSDTTSLSDFLFNSVALEEGFGPCIRRSDGRLYAIKKALQTQRAWSELTILRKIKENQVLFNQWLYWAFERDHCIYFIVENCPSGCLADAVMCYGMLGSSSVFFFACEILMGLRSLHEVGIVHHNVSPNTIIFDRYGHVVLSGMEYSSLQSGGKCLHDIPNIEDKGYQAPELLSGWNHNILVDSWSFGMVLYFMFHGKHLSLPGKEFISLGKPTKKSLPGEFLNEAIQLFDQTARDLIVKCLEPNPILRPSMHRIQHHPYFSNADWGKVLRQETPGPLPREFLASNIVGSTKKTRDANLLDLERGFPFQLGQPLPPECHQMVPSQALPGLFRSPFAALKTQVETRTSFSSVWSAVSPNVSMDGLDGAHTPDLQTPRRDVDHWNSLSCGGPVSLDDMEPPSSRTWDLLKKRSRVLNPRRYIDFRSAIHKKFRKKPESIVARKYATYAEPITHLPRGLNQVGSGIGFTYAGCAAPTTAGILSSRFLRLFRLAGSGSENERDSNLSESLTSAPKSCGLFHGLDMSGFWAGFKSGSTTPPRILQVEDTSVLDINLEFSLEHSDPLPDRPARKKQRYPGTQPLAESTARFSKPKSSLSLLTTPTEPAVGAGKVLTYHGVTIPKEAFLIPEDEIVDFKKLEGGLAPESTLRLVTVLNSP